VQQAALAAVALGFLGMVVALASDLGMRYPGLMLTWIGGGLGGGTIAYALDRYHGARGHVDHDGVMFSQNQARGALGWGIGVVLTGLYILLYWFPDTLWGLIRVADPLALALRGSAADQWFLYGTLYTLAVVVMGVRAALKYRHSRYHLIRTASVVFFQLGFAFLAAVPPRPVPAARALLPLLLAARLHRAVPLAGGGLAGERAARNVHGVLGARADRAGDARADVLLREAVVLLVGVRVRRAGGDRGRPVPPPLGQEPAGVAHRAVDDPRVLVFIVLTTALLWVDQAQGGGVLGGVSGLFARWYGFFIGAAFAGVVGVGFYPLMGSRVWCRFGCPMAAILGLQQRFFSRFRITTNGGQCISCGNCSAYCEMGIDVRWYAQRGQNVVRASCVGCGICATVCPRGVLRLENGPREGRFGAPTLNLIPDLEILED
jgi:ferredoxin-type protein NapH